MPAYCRVVALSLLVSALLPACATPRREQRQVSVGGIPLKSDQLEAEWVRAATTARRRGNTMVFRAPELRLEEVVEVSPGGSNQAAEKVESARAGYLVGEQDLASGVMKHFLVFQWDLVDRRRHYQAVALADGTPLTFQTASTGSAEPCAVNCMPVVQTLIAEVPERSLQVVPPTGFLLRITLDDGVALPVRVPQSYVRGYLQAVDAGR